MIRRVVLSASVVVLVVVGLVAFSVARDRGLLTPFGVSSSSDDSQVVRTIERTGEVSLLSLGIEGIETEREAREVFGKELPGTGRTLFVRYNFTAKLGVDGEAVKVTEEGEDEYVVTVPAFEFIGYDDLKFESAAEDTGVLSFVTADPEQFDALETVLSPKARADYVAQHEDLLRDQTESFYDSLITSVDADAEVTYEFTASPA